jgi:hypothetical protein
MNDIARQLRAQIPSSTDPHRLEQMARDAEGRPSSRRLQCLDNQEELRVSLVRANVPSIVPR